MKCVKNCANSFFFYLPQRLFPLLPTAEEKARIEEERLAYPDVPLASAEQFLLTMSSVNELCSRLKLWQFSLEYESIERVRKNVVIFLNETSRLSWKMT